MKENEFFLDMEVVIFSLLRPYRFAAELCLGFGFATTGFVTRSGKSRSFIDSSAREASPRPAVGRRADPERVDRCDSLRLHESSRGRLHRSDRPRVDARCQRRPAPDASPGRVAVDRGLRLLL